VAALLVGAHLTPDSGDDADGSGRRPDGDRLRTDSEDRSFVGSVLLIPEVLIKPFREERHDEVATLAFFLSRLDLRPVDAALTDLAVVLGARYGLKAIDATHLATAVSVGADRFITNNRRDFDAGEIEEIDIVYPEWLESPGA
jgi:predicted nucleic acid-binding protein